MKPQFTLFTCLLILCLAAGCATQASPPATEIAATATLPPAITSAPVPTLSPTLPPTFTPIPTPTGPQARVVDFINKVDAHAQAGEDWLAALQDMAIYLGGEVWAKEASTARLQLAQDLVRVAPNTIFTFSEPGANALQVDLQQGQLWLNIQGLQPGASFEVTTPAASASVRGTRFSVRVGADGRTVVSVVDGSVAVTGQGQEVIVNPYQQTSIDTGQSPTPVITMTLQEHLLWMNASGPALDTTLPISTTIQEIGQPGKITSLSWSYDGDLLTYYLQGQTHDASHPHFYNYHTRKHVPSPLPGESWAVTFNPAGPGLAFNHWSDGVEICTITDLPGLSLSAASFQTGRSAGSTKQASEPVCFKAPPNHKLGQPFWSPDGQWIMFYSSMTLTDTVSSQSALGLRSISAPSEPPFAGLVNHSNIHNLVQVGETALNLFRARPDLTGLNQVTFDTELVYNHRPSWSPDSQQIAFVASVDYGQIGDLWIVNADGSNRRRVFTGVQGGGYVHPAWSPDQEWLAIAAETDRLLWLIRPDGSDAHPLPRAPSGLYTHISWSPSPAGWPLLFQLEVDETIYTYLVSSEGAEPLLLPLLIQDPTWAPTGNRLALIQNTTTDNQVQGLITLFSAIPELWPPSP